MSEAISVRDSTVNGFGV